MTTLPETAKSSIFTCKSCKTAEVKIDKKPRNISTETQLQDSISKPFTLKLEPAKLSHQDQKYVIKNGNKTIGFGAKGYSDFTINKDESRKEAYISRHSKREEQFWDPKEQNNLLTASFWSRYLLWENADIFDAIKNIEVYTGIPIRYTRNTIDKHQKKLAKIVKKSGEDLD